MSIDAPDQLNGHTPPLPLDVPFRPGKGGQFTHEWASYMLHQWWLAREKKLTFEEATRRTAVHFMVESHD